MSIKPKIILNEEVTTQILSFQSKRDQLTQARDAIAARLSSIEHIIKENVMLEQKTKEQVGESVNLFLEEWINLRECYPEVRLGILVKTLEFIAGSETIK